MRDPETIPYCVIWEAYDERTSSTLEADQDCYRPTEVVATLKMLALTCNLKSCKIRTPSGVVSEIDLDKLAEF